jgi:lysophospholipase L1-like esterase
MDRSKHRSFFFLLAFVISASAFAGGSRDEKWVATWTTSPQGPYPIGYMVGQPLMTYALPGDVAHEQSFRLIVHPSVWGESWRIRLSNNFGNAPIVIGHAYIGVQKTGSTLVPGTNRELRFGGRRAVTIPVGVEVFSDPVELEAGRGAEALAVSLYAPGTSGAITFHAAAFGTSYISFPGTGDHTASEKGDVYANSTTSWYWLDGLEVKADSDTEVVVAFGDSITDGFFSTLNGEDRWPNFLDRRLKAKFGSRFSVVNEAIGGNMVVSVRPAPGCTLCDGERAFIRLDRDVLRQAGVRTVVWLEGINDIGGADNTAGPVIEGMKTVISRVHARGLRIIGATLTPSSGTAFGSYGTAVTDTQRNLVNEFIRHGGWFDGVVDFDAATRDPANPGFLLPAFNLQSTTGGMGDFLHPSRPGFVAMANAFDLSLFR